MPTAEGIFPKNGGDPGYYSEANFFFSKIGSVHNGAGLDVATANGSSVLVLNGSPALVQASYVRIVTRGQCAIAGNLNGTDTGGPITMTLEAAESGTAPAYTQIYSGTLYSWHYGGGGLGANTGWNSESCITHEHLHTLTAGQKTSGVQVRWVVTNGNETYGFSGGRAFLEFA